jgi:hypothetical protein
MAPSNLQRPHKANGERIQAVDIDRPQSSEIDQAAN